MHQGLRVIGHRIKLHTSLNLFGSTVSVPLEPRYSPWMLIRVPPCMGPSGGLTYVTLGCSKDTSSLGFDCSALREGGYQMEEMRHVTFSAYDLREAGYYASELKAIGWTAKELRDGGYPLKVLRALHFPTWQMKALA